MPFPTTKDETMHGFDGWHMGGMWLWWLLVPILVGLIVWLVVTQSGRRRGGRK